MKTSTVALAFCLLVAGGLLASAGEKPLSSAIDEIDKTGEEITDLKADNPRLDESKRLGSQWTECTKKAGDDVVARELCDMTYTIVNVIWWAVAKPPPSALGEIGVETTDLQDTLRRVDESERIESRLAACNEGAGDNVVAQRVCGRSFIAEINAWLLPKKDD